MSRQGRDMLRRDILLAAEAAAHQLIFHHDPLFLIKPSEHDRDLAARVVSPLVGA